MYAEDQRGLHETNDSYLKFKPIVKPNKTEVSLIKEILILCFFSCSAVIFLWSLVAERHTRL